MNLLKKALIWDLSFRKFIQKGNLQKGDSFFKKTVIVLLFL